MSKSVIAKYGASLGHFCPIDIVIDWVFVKSFFHIDNDIVVDKKLYIKQKMLIIYIFVFVKSFFHINNDILVIKII
jgi:hypothetical protein